MLFTTFLALFATLAVARKVERRQSPAILDASTDTFLELDLVAAPSTTVAVGAPLSVPAQAPTNTATIEASDPSPPANTEADEVETTSAPEPLTLTTRRSSVVEPTTATHSIVTKPTALITTEEVPISTTTNHDALPTVTVEPSITTTLLVPTTTHDTSTITSGPSSTITVITSYTIPPGTTTITPSSTATPSPPGGGLSTAAKAGIGGGIGGLAILTAACVAIWYVRRKEAEEERNRPRTQEELAIDHYTGRNVFHPQRHAAHHAQQEPTVPAAVMSGALTGFDGKSELPGDARYHPQVDRMAQAAGGGKGGHGVPYVPLSG